MAVIDLAAPYKASPKCSVRRIISEHLPFQGSLVENNAGCILEKPSVAIRYFTFAHIFLWFSE